MYCTFNYAVCSAKDFYWEWDNFYGNCFSFSFSFNSGFNLTGFNRYPRRHLTKINNAPIEHQHNVNAYLEQAQRMQPSNSLNFETDMFVKPKTSRHRKPPTDPYRHTLLHPWKHAYFSYQYPECRDEYKRVRSTTEWFDLSKY